MQQFIDNWSATLLAPITSTSLSLSVEPAKAALLTGLGGGAFYRLTLVEVDGAGAEVDWDVVHVTAVAGGVLTVTRTDTARSWASGALIEARLTAAGMGELRDSGSGVAPEDLAEVAFSGDYADLANTPTIPSTAADVAAIPTSQKGAASGVATLDGDAKVPLAQLPATAITNTSVINTESAMLALVAQVGDVAIRTDISTSFILKDEPASTLSNWQQIMTPATGGGAPVGSATPQALGDASPGVSSNASREDHVHPLPTPAAIGAATSAQGALADSAVQPGGLKTVGGNSLLGSGDIPFSGGASLAQVVAYGGTAKTLALTDINTIVDCTSSSAVTITIPPQSSVTWSADAEIHVRMSGTGAVSIAVGSGVTIPPLSAPVGLGGQGAIVTLKRRSSDVWMIAGVTVPQQLGTPYASAGGTANAITLTTNYAPAKQTALVAGHQVRARVGTTNTGATTMALDGLTAKTCVTVTGAALPAGYIRTGVDTEFTYDVTGDRWIVGREAEYGSNANGTFLRFADGRQECRHTLTGLTASLGAGAIFYSPSASWTFPAAFIAAPPELGAFATRTGGAGLVWPGQSNETASTTSMTFRMVSSTSGAEASMLVSAKGSWY